MRDIGDNAFWLALWSVAVFVLGFVVIVSIPACHQEAMRKYDLLEKCFAIHNPTVCKAGLHNE